MGKQSKHFNNTRKTYSRALCSYENNDEAGKKKRYVSRRKPLPKFEDLFITKKTEKELEPSFISCPVYETKPFSADLSRSFSSNDTFDSIRKPTMCNKENFLQDKLAIDKSSLKSSSENSENEAFLSALHLTTSKVADMFVSYPLQSNRQKKEDRPNILGIFNTPQTVNTNSIFTPESVKKKTSFTEPLINMMTSTPLVVQNDVNKLSKRTNLENELSHIDKDRSCLFESRSDESEPDSQFISCYLQPPMSSPLSDRFNNIDPATLPECFVSLPKLRLNNENEATSVRNSILTVSDDLFKSENDDGHIQSSGDSIVNSTFLKPSCTSGTRTNFIRITRRRKRCFDHLKFKSNRNALINLSRSSLSSFSHNSISRKCSKSSYFARSRPSLHEDASKLKQSEDELSRLSTTSCQMLSYKAGKGWRRSVRKRSYERMVQSFSLQCTSSVDLERNANVTSMDKSMESNLSLSILKIVPLSNEEDTDPRSYVLNLCQQEFELPFEQCFDQRIHNCKKIGEGLYGEVFLYSGDSESCKRVLKVMPIEGSITVNGEPQKTFVEIAPEIVVSRALCDLGDATLRNFTSCFVGVHQCWCVRGPYLPKLLALWDDYAAKKGSENDRPDFYPDNQLHIVLEFEFAGTDLESFRFNNAMQAYSAFLQIAFALSVAEAALEFEHRDLHWGNILISHNDDKFIQFIVNNETTTLKTNGVKATFIDYTLSRLVSHGRTFFNDLACDPSLFTAEGDYQFEIYRMMQKANGNNWERYHPVTNIYWLHYILTKMVLPNGCHYKNIKSKIHKEGIKKLTVIRDTIMEHSSSLEFVSNFIFD